MTIMKLFKKISSLATIIGLIVVNLGVSPQPVSAETITISSAVTTKKGENWKGKDVTVASGGNLVIGGGTLINGASLEINSLTVEAG